MVACMARLDPTSRDGNLDDYLKVLRVWERLLGYSLLLWNAGAPVRMSSDDYHTIVSYVWDVALATLATVVGKLPKKYLESDPTGIVANLNWPDLDPKTKPELRFKGLCTEAILCYLEKGLNEVSAALRASSPRVKRPALPSRKMLDELLSIAGERVKDAQQLRTKIEGMTKSQLDDYFHQ